MSYEEYEEIKRRFLDLPLENKHELMDSLPPDEKVALGQRLLGESGLTVILGGNNVLGSSTAFQVNSSAEEISETLNGMPPEAVAEFLKATATSIVYRSQSQNHHPSK